MSKLSILVILSSLVFFGCGQSKDQIQDQSGIHRSANALAAAGDTEATLVAEKVRLRDNGDKKVFEYLDPAAAIETWVEFGTIETYPVGTQYYHWGPKEDVKYWAKYGISSDEIAENIRTVDDWQAVGNGFYLSLDETDSSEYGTHLLVAEPEHMPVVLAIPSPRKFDAHRVALLSGDGKVWIPLPAIADSGVEAMRYSETWLVAIRGSILENLFEGSWKNFLARNPDEFLSRAKMFAFSKRYPVTKSVLNGTAFRTTYPELSRILLGEGASESYLEKTVSDLFAKLLGGQVSESTLFEAFPDFEGWREFLDQVRAGCIVKFTEVAKKVLSGKAEFKSDPKSEGKLSEAMLLRRLTNLKIKISEVMPGHQDLVSQEFVSPFPGGAPLVDKIMMPLSAMVKLRPALKTGDFYDVLNAVVNGTLSDSTGAPGDGELELLDEELRDGPLREVGEHLLDGPNQPGYFEVTEAQKQEISDNTFLIPKFAARTDSTGRVHHYVHYEYPSAANYKRFKFHLVDPQLISDLEAAEIAGQLSDTQAPEFKSLTKRVLRELVKNISNFVSLSISRRVHTLTKIHPIKDPIKNRLYLRRWREKASTAYYILDENWERAATFAEFAAMISTTSSFKIRSLFYLGTKGDTKLNPSLAIGLWEIAANNPGPHENPEHFIQVVMKRFKEKDVQAWIAKRQYGKVYAALQKAGAGL